MIKRLTKDQHSALLRSKRSLLRAAEWAAEAQDILRNYFADPKTKDILAVSFVATDDGLGAEIITPFGNGRAVAVNAIAEDGAKVRYVFEKSVSFENGKYGHVKVAEIRIDADGLVTSEDGTKLADLNSLHDSESSDAVREAGLSVIYAFGASDQYSAVAE